MRIIYQTHGVLRSLPAKGSHADESGKYRDYLDMSLPISQVSPHRLLAMLRGARDGALSLHLAPLDEDGLAALRHLRTSSPSPSKNPTPHPSAFISPCFCSRGAYDWTTSPCGGSSTSDQTAHLLPRAFDTRVVGAAHPARYRRRDGSEGHVIVVQISDDPTQEPTT